MLPNEDFKGQPQYVERKRWIIILHLVNFFTQTIVMMFKPIEDYSGDLEFV